MDLTDTDKVCPVGFVKAVQIRRVLEIVCIQIAIFKRSVRQDIIIINHDLKIVALFRETILDELKNLTVRSGAGTDDNWCQVISNCE